MFQRFGSIILFHNDAKYTPKVLDSIIKGLKEKGYEIVPISSLIHRDNYYMDHEGRQKLNDATAWMAGKAQLIYGAFFVGFVFE